MPDTRRMSQSEKALLRLRAMVLNGDFPANARLPEMQLSDRLGISRTPLRQAMGQLIDEGLLERIDSGGCRVVRFSMNDVVDAIEIRGVVEGTAARLAAERGADPVLLDECHEVLAALDQAVFNGPGVDFETYVHENARFHALVARLAGSSVIRREVERVSRLPLASPSAFLQGQAVIPDFQASLRLAQTQHRALIEAIEAREGARAEAMAREHARLARKNLAYVTTENPELAGHVPGLALVAT